MNYVQNLNSIKTSRKCCGKLKSKVQFLFRSLHSWNCRPKTQKIQACITYELRLILQFVVQCDHRSLCGIRGPAGKSVPRAPCWQKTALLICTMYTIAL